MVAWPSLASWSLTQHEQTQRRKRFAMKIREVSFQGYQTCASSLGLHHQYCQFWHACVERSRSGMDAHKIRAYYGHVP
jgi:hypothetical protein